MQIAPSAPWQSSVPTLSHYVPTQAVSVIMSFFENFSFSFPASIRPALVASVAILSIVLLARPRRSPVRRSAFVRRRLGLPKGVVRWLVISAAAIVALLALGIDLEGLWSTLVAALSLVAIGFVAMWSILSHMLASILIVIFRPFGVGDRVEVIGDDPVTGEVLDLNPVYTTLRAADGGTLQVPNNVFFQKAFKRHARAAPTRSQPSTAPIEPSAT